MYFHIFEEIFENRVKKSAKRQAGQKIRNRYIPVWILNSPWKHPNVFQTLQVLYRYGELSILLVIFLCLGWQIEIFGEAPFNLKSELKIAN